MGWGRRVRLPQRDRREIHLDRKEMSADLAKRAAAICCAKQVLQNGLKVGVGSGTTIKYLIDYVKEKRDQGELQDIICVPTSFQTRKLLQDAGIPVATLETHWDLDIAIDGADEMDKNYNCIKGGGGCLTQEKIVQNCARDFFMIADSSKASNVLGETFKYIPLEVIPFAYVPVQKQVERIFGGKCELRMAKMKCGAVITDNNNYIIDWYFPPELGNTDWRVVDQRLHLIPGLVETGLFVGVVKKAFLGNKDGGVQELTP
ncbi:unnamed protein product [Bursaphelenchus xylophilus]|uniref:ribose-5-phosphate isomerase n=2 Tax=Bursaphelenchus xylophilus TaxID=6326 RepID=A0A7I8XII4_BURXY|nr:unnamed protein product [Bursaphelenchus xylophilus]CAG9085740.1 unnamed protein product [Bursaphelenchus xylophilus]